MINLKNRVKKIKINEKKLIKDAQRILDILDYADFDLGILLTSNEAIRKFNRDFREKDKPTDILSFPFYPDLRPPERIEALSSEEKNLGDLILSLEYIEKDAGKWDQNLEQRLRVLLVHGICHLLGYDHIEDSDYRVMQAREDEILRQLKG
jgi:probable rRNA maturation factor